MQTPPNPPGSSFLQPAMPVPGQISELSEMLVAAAQDSASGIESMPQTIRAMQDKSYHERQLLMEQLELRPDQRLLTLFSQLLEGRMDSQGRFRVCGLWPDVCDVRRFANEATMAACIVGKDRIAALLTTLIRENRVFYQDKFVVPTACLDKEEKEIEDNGITLCQLSDDKSELAEFVPQSLLHRMGEQQCMNMIGGQLAAIVRGYASPAIISAESEFSPPIWRPGNEKIKDAGFMPMALSLVSRASVRYSCRWQEFGDLSAFPGCADNDPDLQESSYSMQRGTITGKHLSEALAICRKLKERFVGDQVFRAAADRYLKAVEHGSHQNFGDLLIDLRIALEILYLRGVGSGHGKKGFSSLFCAWHLGSSYDERRQYNEIISKAYGWASGVIHGDIRGFREGEIADIKKAVELCGRGIVKRIDQPENPDMMKAVLEGRL